MRLIITALLFTLNFKFCNKYLYNRNYSLYLTGNLMKFQIKKAKPTDAEFIGPLFDSYRIFYQKASNILLAKKFIAERLKRNESTIYYAKAKDGDFVGFVQLYPTFSSISIKRSWILNDLYVKPHIRNLGVAKQLMQAAHQLARETDASEIVLETAPDNISAQKLYDALGYKLNNEYLNYSYSL